MSYNSTLKNGQELFIPSWPASVALENLSKAGKYIGADNLTRIAELNTAAAMVAIMEAKDSKNTTELIKHFVCEARIDGKKINKQEYDTQFYEDIYIVIEIFCHVVKAQYFDFFKQGLVRETSPSE